MAASNAKGALWGYRLLRWALGATFLVAGATKLLRPDEFAIVIQAFGLLPDAWTEPVALLLPTIEVLAALGLIFDVQGSLEAIAGLLASFLLLLGYGLWLGLDVDCGCFGPHDPEGLAYAGIRPAFYRDWLLLAGVAGLYGLRKTRGFAPLGWRSMAVFKS